VIWPLMAKEDMPLCVRVGLTTPRREVTIFGLLAWSGLAFVQNCNKLLQVKLISPYHSLPTFLFSLISRVIHNTEGFRVTCGAGVYYT
jgi:hypothetical protein